MRGSTTAARRRPGRVALAGLAVGLAAVLASTTGGAPVLAAAPAAAAEDQADWTMMVYAVADTDDIGSLMTQDLAELTALPDDPDVNIVVLVDMPAPGQPGGGNGDLPGIGPFSTAKLLTLEGGRFVEIRDLGELSMGRPDTLATFIEEAADRFPAAHYGLTLMDHGGAYGGGYLDVSPTSEQMRVSDIRTGMASGMQRAGIDRFDVLFHSSCLMSNFEAASALAPLADVVAGSEEVMYVFAMLPAAGFAAAQSGGDGQDIGEAFLDAYVTRIEQEQPFSAQDAEDLAAIRDLIAVSVVDGDQMAVLGHAMESFTRVAVEHMDEIVTQVARARAETLQFVFRSPGMEPGVWDLFDLGDFLAHLEDVPEEVAVARDAAYAALTHAVTHKVTGRGTSQAKGLSVFFPDTAARQLDRYVELGLGPSGWGEFLEAFVEASASSGTDSPQGGGAQFASPDAQVLQADATGIKIAGQLVSGGSAAVVQAETQVFTSIGGQPDTLAVALPAYVDAGSAGQVQGVWDYSTTALTDGQQVVPATTVYQGQAGGLVGTFLAQYVSPAGDATDIGVRVLLSSQGDIESVSTFSLNGEGSTAGVNLEIGGRLTPYLFVASAGEFKRQLSQQSIPVTEELGVGFVRLRAGTPFRMGVVVSDASGAVDGAFTTQEVR